MTESMDETTPYPPYACLVFTGDNLDPDQITEMLKINPTKCARRGDVRAEIHIWQNGLWMLRSTDHVDSTDPVAHLQWLVDQIYPAKDAIMEISRDADVYSVLKCFWIMPSTHEYFLASPELLSRLGAFQIQFEMSIYTHDA